MTVQFHISRALYHVKNQLQGEQLGLWSILSAPGDLHKFEVHSHDESLRRRITKLDLKIYKEQLDFV